MYIYICVLTYIVIYSISSELGTTFGARKIKPALTSYTAIFQFNLQLPSTKDRLCKNDEKNVQKCHLKRFNQFSFNSFLSCRPALWIQRNANTCRAKLSVVRRERTVSQTLVVDVFKTTVTERQLYQSLKKTRCPRAHPLSEVKERKQT